MTSTWSNRKYKAPIEGCISCWFNDRLDLYQVWYRITCGFMFWGIVWICAHSELSRRPIILIELACVFFQYVSILFPGISLPALWINESTTIYVIKICKCTCIVGSTFNRRTIWLFSWEAHVMLSELSSLIFKSPFSKHYLYSSRASIINSLELPLSMMCVIS